MAGVAVVGSDVVHKGTRSKEVEVCYVRLLASAGVPTVSPAHIIDSKVPTVPAESNAFTGGIRQSCHKSADNPPGGQPCNDLGTCSSILFQTAARWTPSEHDDIDASGGRNLLRCSRLEQLQLGEIIDGIPFISTHALHNAAAVMFAAPQLGMAVSRSTSLAVHGCRGAVDAAAATD